MKLPSLYSEYYLFSFKSKQLVALEFLPLSMIIPTVVDIESQYQSQSEKPLFEYFDNNYLRGKKRKGHL